jgi:ATP-dependent Zn protease
LVSAEILSAPTNDRRATAIHEAGHAVIGRVLRLLCGEATIEENQEAGEAGYAITADPFGIYGAWDDRGIYRGDMMASILKARIMTYMAGREAEEECIGHCEGGDGDDLHQIALMADSLPVADDELDRYERRLRARTRGLVRRHRTMIERVAGELLEHTTLEPERLDELVGRPLPPVIPRPAYRPT